MDPETVIERIQEDTTAEVLADANAGAAVVAAEVQGVSEDLEEHAELSEERHEEILEGELWTRNQLGLLLTNSQTILTTQAAMQAAMMMEFQTLRAAIESTGTPQSPQIQEPVIAIVEPPAVVVPVVPEVPVIEEPPKRRRRAI